jgi:hypothetical protein
MRGFHDGVPGHHDAFPVDTLVDEVHRAAPRGSEVHVGEGTGQESVDLLGHRTVVGPEPGLDVTDGDPEIVRRLCRGRDGVRVSLDKDRPRPPLLEDRGELAQHAGDLFSPRLPPDPVHADVGFSDAEHLAVLAGEFVVVVLAGIDDEGVVAQLCDDGRQLDDLGARAVDDRDSAREAHCSTPVSILIILMSPSDSS